MVGNPGGILGNLQTVIKIVRAFTDSHFNPFCAQFRLIRGENMTVRQSCQYFFCQNRLNFPHKPLKFPPKIAASSQNNVFKT